ncbi:hypothetical protein [Afipia sp. GAS231]|uniref:hypothetical protein n=1 Tax=Afipia sp. GAS231 TaxID=1882747 RepID=UPI00087C65EA|nr:hypothetical protein [Afipia sp. GAS231]SDO05349.1 hypothetical protein SAMN05444050_3095 [Afipia sp. GAS231]
MTHGRQPGHARRGTDGAGARRPPLFARDEATRPDEADLDVTTDEKDYDFVREPGFWIAILLGCLPVVASYMYILFMGD